MKMMTTAEEENAVLEIKHIECGFRETKVSHYEHDGYFKSSWEKGDTITVVCNRNVRYYTADTDGSQVTFSLSSEHQDGLRMGDGAKVYAITRHVEVKDGAYALLEELMGHQSFSHGALPLDFQTSTTTIKDGIVDLSFSYPLAFLRMEVPKRKLVDANYQLVIKTVGGTPFVFANNEEPVGDGYYFHWEVNPYVMPDLQAVAGNWQEESTKYPYLIYNIISSKLISHYNPFVLDTQNGYVGTNNYYMDDSMTYCFDADELATYDENDLVPFFVAIPETTDCYMIYVYGANDLGSVLFEKEIPSEGILPNHVYNVNLEERYFSTDYSRDGEVVLYQTATVGKGIDVVFMGDGYTDKLMGPEGKYAQDMEYAIEELFSHEPYKSYRNRFNLYYIKVVCPYNGAEGDDSPLTDYSSFYDYYDNIPQSDDKIVRAIILKHFGTDLPTNIDHGNSYCVMYDDGSFIVRMDNLFLHPNNVLFHEFTHGMGKVLDEYWTNDESYPEEKKALLNSFHNKGWGLNLDTTNDPQQVIWSHFLMDDRFSSEGISYAFPDMSDASLGVFEGGDTYRYGVYRPSYYSVMNDTFEIFGDDRVYDWLNAPSRESIYKQIMHYSEGDDWVYDYESFVLFDSAYRKDIADYYGRFTKSTMLPSSGTTRKNNGHMPPLYCDSPAHNSKLTKLDIKTIRQELSMSSIIETKIE